MTLLVAWSMCSARECVEAVEQGDEADEARLEVERGMVGGLFRDRVVIVWVPACLRASQLIPSVLRTWR